MTYCTICRDNIESNNLIGVLVKKTVYCKGCYDSLESFPWHADALRQKKCYSVGGEG